MAGAALAQRDEQTSVGGESDPRAEMNGDGVIRLLSEDHLKAGEATTAAIEFELGARDGRAAVPAATRLGKGEVDVAGSHEVRCQRHVQDAALTVDDHGGHPRYLAGDLAASIDDTQLSTNFCHDDPFIWQEAEAPGAFEPLDHRRNLDSRSNLGRGCLSDLAGRRGNGQHEQCHCG